MAEETQINYVENLRTLAESQEVGEKYQVYRKNLGGEDPKEGDLSEPLQGLERILGNEATEGSFMTASPQAIDYAVRGYHEANKESVKKAAEESGAKLAEQYVSGLDNLIRAVIENISGQKGFDKLEPEQREQIIRSKLYINLAKALEELKPKDEEIAKADEELKGLDKATEDQRQAITERYLEENGMDYMRYAVDSRRAFPRIKKQMSSMIYRLIGSKLIKEEAGNYKIDADKFKEIYGSEENYKKIAYDFLEAAREAQRQAGNREER